MKKLKNSLFVLIAFVLIIFGAQMVSAAEEGVTGDGFKWSYEDGIMAITAYEGNAATINIPSKINGIPVSTIAPYAFMDCTGLASIMIPNSVTTIDNGAFYGCTSLKSIAIPNSVTKLCTDVFYNCTGLTSITIPNSITVLGPEFLLNCTSLKSVRIPESVIDIGEHAFGFYGDQGEEVKKAPEFTIYGYYGSMADLYARENGFIFVGEPYTKDIRDGVLTKFLSYQHDFIIPEGITEIGKEVFAERAYTSIKLPETLTKIGEGAFSYCSELTSLNIPKGVSEIGSRAFEGCCSLESITIPNQISKINSYTFFSCSGVKKIVIPDSVREIDDFAFGSCHGMTSLTIPDTVKKIGEMAFTDCTSLTSITLPNSVTKIARSTFSDCTSLKSFTIPKSVTEIEEFAFLDCPNLKSITIPATVKKLDSSAFGFFKDGMKFKKVKGFIVCGYPGTAAEKFAKEEGFTFKDLSDKTSDKTITVSKHKYEINKDRKSVTYCGPSDKTVVKVKIPDTITLSGIKYNVTVIKKEAFKKCKSLKTVTMGKKVTTIGDSAFQSCTGLKQVTIGMNVKTIGKNSFSGCSSLQKVTFNGSKLIKIGTKAFYKAGSKNYKKLQVIVPKKKYKVYKNKLLKAKLSKNVKIKKK